jgi:hypothetical protein
MLFPLLEAPFLIGMEAAIHPVVEICLVEF